MPIVGHEKLICPSAPAMHMPISETMCTFRIMCEIDPPITHNNI